MLVLSRNPGERLIFTCGCGCRGIVQVLAVQGRAVKLGIDASPQVRVLREEIAECDSGRFYQDIQELQGQQRPQKDGESDLDGQPR